MSSEGSDPDDDLGDERDDDFRRRTFSGSDSDADTPPPRRKSTVLVNKNAGFVRVRRVFDASSPGAASQTLGAATRKSVAQSAVQTISEEADAAISAAPAGGGIAEEPARDRRKSTAAAAAAAAAPTPRKSVSSRRNSFVPIAIQTASSKEVFFDMTLAQAQEVRDVFDLFDTDGSGSIDPSELRIVMRALGFNLTVDEVKDIATWFWKEDSDGALSFEEFLYVMAVKMSQKDESEEIRRSFQLFDVDGRGRIGPNELRKVARELGDALTDEDALMMIAENDLDGDGELDERDWAKIFLG
ncbi:Centrin-1 [Entophlyctis luteolus]|nr:Centrin-1 [Entophlyctis luteolus]